MQSENLKLHENTHNVNSNNPFANPAQPEHMPPSPAYYPMIHSIGKPLVVPKEPHRDRTGALCSLIETLDGESPAVSLSLVEPVRPRPSSSRIGCPASNSREGKGEGEGASRGELGRGTWLLAKACPLAFWNMRPKRHSHKALWSAISFISHY